MKNDMWLIVIAVIFFVAGAVVGIRLQKLRMENYIKETFKNELGDVLRYSPGQKLNLIGNDGRTFKLTFPS